MAITQVKGTITRTFYEGRGVEVTEEYVVRGEPRKVRWACFFEQPHNLTEGQPVEITGLHGDKVDEWEKDGEKRHTIKRTINRARVIGAQVGAPAGDQWAGVDTETPF